MKNIWLTIRSRVSSPVLSLLGAAFVFTPRPSYAQDTGGFLDGLGTAIGDIASSVGTALVGALDSAANVLLNMGIGQLNSAINTAFADLFGTAPCSDNGTISDVLCNVMDASNGLPGFVTAMAYTIGLVMTMTALFKLKDHVLNPNQTHLSESVKRFIAGGALFTLPLITEAAQNALTGGNNAMSSVSGYAGSTGGGYGLDTMMVALFLDIYTPLMSVIFAFAYLAGIILTVVGITRIIKTSQDGPRGPASMGTIMTFAVAGVLFSLSTIMGSFSTSMFGASETATFAMLMTSSGDAAVDDHILAIISTVLVFMTIIGYISFLRGFFILKDVAEGSGQASLMAAVTHIFGGALAVNLGPLLNAVQSTLGLQTLGIVFY